MDLLYHPGICFQPYLDVCLVSVRPVGQAMDHVTQLVRVLESHGFLINSQKSVDSGTGLCLHRSPVSHRHWCGYASSQQGTENSVPYSGPSELSLSKDIGLVESSGGSIGYCLFGSLGTNSSEHPRQLCDSSLESHLTGYVSPSSCVDVYKSGSGLVLDPLNLLKGCLCALVL